MKFICDDNLGKLAKWLRTLGYDTLFSMDIEDTELVSKALKDNRIILSRDTELKRFKSAEKNFLLLSSNNPLEQLKEVLRKYNLKPEQENLFTRCMVCNQVLVSVPKKEVENKVPPFVFKTQESFVYCSKCDKLYWGGTHVKNLKKKIIEENLL
ncbi:MAG: Mut7-C RNAse domain-containing protein [Candidatus Zixiibacteriota bacterium]